MPATAHTEPGTLTVDAALQRDGLGVPPGVGEWLRSVERRARLLASALTLAASAPLPAAAVVEAQAVLERFLAADRTGALHRLVSRTLQQLTDESAARANFDGLTNELFAQAESAIKLQKELDDLYAALVGVRGRYFNVIPGLLREHLRRARLTDADLASVRRAEDVQRMRPRLARVEAILASYMNAAGSDVADVVTDAAAGGEALTVQELRIALAAYCRQRHQFLDSRLPPHLSYDIASRHIGTLAALNAHRPPRDGGSSAAAVVEQLARRAVERHGELSPDATDVSLWLGLYAGAHNAAFPRGDRYQWRSSLGALGSTKAADTSRTPNDAIIHYVLPVGAGYVFIGTHLPSPIRIHSRRIAVGHPTECHVFGTEGAGTASELAAAEIGALFDGASPEESGWYGTRMRAVLMVLYEVEDGWFARIAHRGTLEAIRQPAWKRELEQPGPTRILKPATRSVFGATTPTDAVTVPVHPHGAVSSFLGFETLIVHAPFEANQTAWLRRAPNRTPDTVVALAREATLFDALRAAADDGLRLAMEPLATGRIAPGRAHWPLYAEPFALRLEDSSAIESWIRSSLRSITSTVHSVARILSAAHGLGWVVGSCHLQSFAYGVRWQNLDAEPLPAAVLTAAPTAARADDRYVPGFGGRQNSGGYRMLGISALLPVVAKVGRATVQADAVLFAAFVLDLLTMTPLPQPSSITWPTLSSTVAGSNASYFSHPDLARALAACLEHSAGRDCLLRGMQFLATTPNASLDDLLHFLDPAAC